MNNFKYTFIGVKRGQKQQKSTHFVTHLSDGRKRQNKGGFLNDSDEVVEIYAQITFNGKKVRISTNAKCPKNWFKSGAIVMMTDDSRKEREAVQKQLNDFADRLDNVGEITSITDVKTRIATAKISSNSVLSSFDVYLTHLQSKKASESTLKRIKCVQKKWVAFERAARHIYTLHEVTTDTLSEFEKYISDEVCLRGRKCVAGSKSNNSIAKYIHTLKAVCKHNGQSIVYSKAEQYTQEPFYLTIAEVKQIEGLNIEDKKTAVYRDYFVLQCRTGLRVGDLRNLNTNNVVVKNNMCCILNNSNKTNTLTSVPVGSVDEVERVTNMIEKLSAFKGFSLAQYNAYIRTILTLANIDRKVCVKQGKTSKYTSIAEVASSHIARRTFVGNLYERGVDRAVITSMSGHVRDSKSLNRYFSVSADQQAEAVKVFF